MKIESALLSRSTEPLILRSRQIIQKTVRPVKLRAVFGRCENGKKMGVSF